MSVLREQLAQSFVVVTYDSVLHLLAEKRERSVGSGWRDMTERPDGLRPSSWQSSARMAGGEHTQLQAMSKRRIGC